MRRRLQGVPRNLATSIAAGTLVLGAVSSCSPTPVSAPSPSPSASPSVHLATEGEEAALGLSVSNQSFADATVHLTITIDGVTVVDDDFEVGNQHNFVGYSLSMPPGQHHLTATSDTGATLETEFVTRAGQTRHAFLSYWNYQDDEGRHIDWHIQNRPLMFA